MYKPAQGVTIFSKLMNLEMDERDVKELVEEPSLELTIEELDELHSQQHTVDLNLNKAREERKTNEDEISPK